MERTSRPVADGPTHLYGAIGVKPYDRSPCSTGATSARPDLGWLGAARGGGQGWPKAIAKRLALDGREHSGRQSLDWVGVYPPAVRACMTIPRGSSPLGAEYRAQACIWPIHEVRNHDAVMRIGGKAPRRSRSELGNARATPPPDGASPPPWKERCPNARTVRDFENPGGRAGPPAGDLLPAPRYTWCIARPRAHKPKYDARGAYEVRTFPRDATAPILGAC
jgi:hypothetical protein